MVTAEERNRDLESPDRTTIFARITFGLPGFGELALPADHFKSRAPSGLMKRTMAVWAYGVCLARLSDDT